MFEILVGVHGLKGPTVSGLRIEEEVRGFSEPYLESEDSGTEGPAVNVPTIWTPMSEHP